MAKGELWGGLLVVMGCAYGGGGGRVGLPFLWLYAERSGCWRRRLRGGFVGVEGEFLFVMGAVWSSRDGSTRCTLVELHEFTRLGIFRSTALRYDDYYLIRPSNIQTVRSYLIHKTT